MALACRYRRHDVHRIRRIDRHRRYHNGVHRMARVTNIMAEARKRTLESMQRMANAEKAGESEISRNAAEDRKVRAHAAYIKWRDTHREEIRLKARLRYHKNHPGSRKYDKCWEKE